VQQVVFRLLGYAIRSSPEGGEVGVSVRRADGAAVVSVRDQGAGLSPEQQVQVFRRFYRSDQADMLGEGSGLGLVIARGIVEAHGGRIWVESEPGRGSTFHFSLPLPK
jgi:signal transduction histidine kinase